MGGGGVAKYVCMSRLCSLSWKRNFAPRRMQVVVVLPKVKSLILIRCDGIGVPERIFLVIKIVLLLRLITFVSIQVLKEFPPSHML